MTNLRRIIEGIGTLDRMLVEDLEEVMEMYKSSDRGWLAEIIANHTPAIIVRLEDSKIVAATGQVERMFGYIERELEGKPLDTLIPVRFRDKHGGHFARYAEQPSERSMGEASMDLVGLHRDGSEFKIEISLFPFFVDDKVGRVVIATIVKRRG